MHPLFISVISTPASFKNPPSIPISPNSFSISTTCSPCHASLSSCWISVVFPAPRNPEMIVTFVISDHPFPFSHYYSTIHGMRTGITDR